MLLVLVQNSCGVDVDVENWRTGELEDWNWRTGRTGRTGWELVGLENWNRRTGKTEVDRRTGELKNWWELVGLVGLVGR